MSGPPACTPVLLTGDHEKAARHIAGELGIGTFQAECLPEDKLTWIDRSQQNGQLVCMVGDGINDAPALKRAHVGIAMGGVGSDIAVDAADIALVNDDIRELPHLLALSKRMMRTIKMQSGLLHDLELHRHRPGHHRYPEPGGGRPGPQRRVRAGDCQLLSAAEVAEAPVTAAGHGTEDSAPSYSKKPPGLCRGAF